MITIICCYNNEKLLKEFVYDSLERQSVEYNLAFIDTRKIKVKSAAQAYNDILSNPQKYGVEITDNLLFVHQDVYFNCSDFLLDIENYLELYPNDVFGYAGMTNDSLVLTNIKCRKIDVYHSSHRVTDITEVSSLDECCFAMKYDLWKKVRFDEYVCNHWHLYVVEFCYNAKAESNSKIYVIPTPIFHKETNVGGLTVDSHFLKSMLRLIKKHKKHNSMIYAPCYVVPTALVPSLIKITRTTVKNFLKKWLGLSF